ncbi:hypothetical protein O9Z70_11025 [Devosia sp. YIM 151766]|uniref:hypothetical protein n=1 Tax=Devosia sp. YIM 151766 TaxID=3017325 RepID=UPI00255CCC8E|nr:hypothetical protein [Devosia sp. YIM 151766]WIY52012.1 hypothetical protein O9Z70_11025 [Devosia sp. YIM 151766]
MKALFGPHLGSSATEFRLCVFEAGILIMALNASDFPADLACVVTGTPITTGEFIQQGELVRLGAWSALAWTWMHNQRE